jgi:hypothetical protein
VVIILSSWLGGRLRQTITQAASGGQTNRIPGVIVRLIDRFVPLQIRAAAVMPAAVLTVHQLRFQLAFGSRADDRLAAEGHQYLTALAPLAAMLVAIAAGLFLAALARTWRRGEGGDRRAPAFLVVWLAAATALLGIYSVQELAEGMVASGHPGGLAGVFGEGGLWAVPLSLLLGAVVGLALRIAGVAIRWVAARRSRPLGARHRPRPTSAPTAVLLAPFEPLASLAAGRAPPLAAALNS